MATWKDGAAYAPTERPDGFATPVADPLSEAEPRPDITPGAVPPPQRLDQPEARPLAEHGSDGSAGRRNPGQPFDVSSATMMSGPRLADGKRDPQAPYSVTAPVASSPLAAPPPPPGARPLPGPPPSQAPLPDVNSSSQRTLIFLMAGLCMLGVIAPAGTPILMIVAGLISVLRVPWTNRIGVIVLGTGATFLLIQLLLPGLSSLGVLFGLSGLIAAAAFLIRAFAKPEDQPRDPWAPPPPPPGPYSRPGPPPPPQRRL